MNAFAMYSAEQALLLAHQRTQELTAAANAHRIGNLSRKSRMSRIAAALASVRVAFAAPDQSRETTVVPRLDDYPYRS